MPKVTFITFDGVEKPVEAPVGENVMRAALENSIQEIKADCGGTLTCATCHVHVAPEWRDRVGPPSGDEIEMLELAVDPAEDSRLCCQIVLSEELDGLVLRLPESQY